MTVEVEQTGTHAGSHRVVSGEVVNALAAMVHSQRGDVGLAQALALAGERRSFADLADPNAWSSIDEAVSLFNASALVTGDGAIGFHVGESLLDRARGSEFVERLVSLGSPEEALKHIGPVVEQFETTSVAVALEVARDHALVRISPRGSIPRHAHLCELTRGLLVQLPVLFGWGPALITEVECSARGGRYCLYAMSWDDPPGPHPVNGAADGHDATQARADLSNPGRPEGGGWRPADRVGSDPGTPETYGPDTSELRIELDRMRVLIEGAFATTLELLSDDVDSLLSEIAARADAVVTAHRYLLMVRVRPGAPIQLHYRGLDVEEAQALASELWREQPDDSDGSRLIVDIASARRRYGRLAELFPPGAVCPPSEPKVLQLYAEYAATALDVFAVLSDARRSDATARTLLSFSEELSRVTNVAELVQVIADTVPAVAECDTSTVYLWEPELSRLVPRARTAGGEALPEDLPMVDRVMVQKEVIVLDGTTENPLVRRLMDQSGTTASVVAPLFAAGEFLGVIAANFRNGTPVTSIHDPDLHERLSGLADQAATSLQNLELLEKISHMAWHDALTGLPNRRLFEDRVEQELVRSRRVGEPVCMFFVDLDHFKSVNDTFGHAAGDDLIQQVSERLVDTVRRQDTVARVGGDEFAILLPGLSDQLAIDQLAQRSLEALNLPFSVFGQEIETSASIGIAMAPDHGDTYDELLSRADEAMYRAKAQGRNAFQMYSGSMISSKSGRQAIEGRTLHSDLIHALQHDEFFILYQPYIDLRTDEVVGVEALVRWEHPTFGTLEPASFISLAERSNVIVALDSWVLAESCRQARRWLDQGLEALRISVNLASRDLSDPDLFANIHRVLDETGIEPSTLELEITERVVLDKAGPAQANIDRLRRLGVRFTIDDFGTGNSSLNRIGSFPVSTLKIDQSFVQVLGPDGDDSLVSAIISMADRLGLDCIAEGVETSTQSRVLLQRGCTTAQGYYFSPPLPPGDIEALMETISRDNRPVAPDDDRF
jgi:diguanylate cyclase (GGDEF)-like protein